MNVQREPANRGLWLVWALATLIGLAFGFFAMFFSLFALQLSFSPPTIVVVALFLFAGILGTIAGVAQLWVFRRYVPKPGGWIVATLLGFLTSSPVLIIRGTA